MTTPLQFDYTAFQAGLRMFVKLTGLKTDPLEHKWIRDEFDVVDAVSSIPYFVKQSARMIGKTMYTKRPYHFIEDVTKDVQEFLIVGKEPRDSALLKKKHLMMYHLVVHPVLDIMYSLPHQDAIIWVDHIISDIISQVMTHNISTTYDDALVAKAQVQKIISARTELLKITKHKRAPRRKSDEHIT